MGSSRRVVEDSWLYRYTTEGVDHVCLLDTGGFSEVHKVLHILISNIY